MDDTIQANKALAASSLIQQRLEVLKKFSNSESKKNLTDKEKAEIEKAARGFESLFVNMLIKEMKSGMLEDKDSEDKFGFGFDILEEYTDLALAEHISKSGKGIGIAEMLYKNLTGGELLGMITSKVPQKQIPVNQPQLNSILR